MITAEGYSKDPNIVPEGIAITFGRQLIDSWGGSKKLLTDFNKYVVEDGNHFFYKCNRPTADIVYVYVIIMGRLYCRGYFGGWYSDTQTVGEVGMFQYNFPGIIVGGPIVMAPFKRKLSGFKNFRYTTKLF